MRCHIKCSSFITSRYNL